MFKIASLPKHTTEKGSERREIEIEIEIERGERREREEGRGKEREAVFHIMLLFPYSLHLPTYGVFS
jgi:hypothetical protein